MAPTETLPHQRAPTLTGQTLSGLRWSYLAAAGSAVIQIGYVAAMSRLLDPQAFGLMAIANIAVSFGFYLARMGVAQALIQRPTINEREVRAAATSGWVLGSSCSVVLWLVAPGVASFFGEPDAVPLLRVMGFGLLLSGLSMTSQGLLRRNMRFRELSTIQVTAAAGGAAVGVVSAVAGAGVWSLVYATLCSNALQLLLQYARTRHPLRPLLLGREFGALYRFGFRSSLIRVGEFAGKNVDTMVVGRLASVTALGLYNRTFFLVNLPVSQYLSSALSTVLFPGFSRIQTDRERVRRTYVSVLRLSALVLFPVCAGMAVASREIVLVALGPQWVEAVPLVPFFAFGAALNIMSKLCSLLAEARDRQNGVITLQVVHLGGLGGLLFVAGTTGGGLWTFAAALASAEVFRHIAFLFLMRQMTRTGVRQALVAYLPAMVVTAAVVTASGAVRGLLAPHLPPLPLLFAQIVVCAAAMLLGIRFGPIPAARRDLRGRLRAAGSHVSRPALSRVIELILGQPQGATTQTEGR